jgi:aminopeptidase
MPDTFDTMLERYADVAIRVGLNLQAGQRLIVIGPRTTGGVSHEAAPLVRHLVASAYRAGSPLVEVLWGDEQLALLRFAHAPRDSFGEFSAWLPQALTSHVEAGGALISVYANDPDLLNGQPPDLANAFEQAGSRALSAFSQQIARNATNWLVVSAAAQAWAAKVFGPGDPADGTRRLWDVIFQMCRLNHDDPVAEWQRHLAALVARSGYLNARQYTALKYKGPGTAVTIGLPPGHVWISGQTASQTGIPFTANLPTEEVFTMPHRDRVDGIVRSTKPLSYGGTLIEDFSLEFVGGQVVKASAARGEAALTRLLEADAGARRLGEIALVPQSSPIADSGLLFYNTLFDENAASHVALGTAYRFTLRDGDRLSDAAFAAAGGNSSRVHVDFMIGSGALDVDGVLPDGGVEPVMRAGEWSVGVPS